MPKVSTSTRDSRTGRYKRLWHLSTKGYPRFHAGPYRNQYVHRVMMAVYLGRELARDEDVDHLDRNRLNWSRRNLKVRNHSVHGFYSSKQKWFVTTVVEPKRKAEWDEYFMDGAVEVMDEGQGYGGDIGDVGDGEGDVTFP